MNKIGIIIGNGISIDACDNFKDKLGYLNTNQFFSWDVPTPDEKEVPFLKRLPVLNEVLTEVESKYKDLNDFEKIEKMINIIAEKQDDFRASMLLSEIQHYLAIAFSKFQLEFSKFDIKDWVWTEWFDRNKKDIIFCHSFNYDLILESILEYCNVNFRRVGVKNEKEGILILKPHGSIDFEITDSAISMPRVTYPLNNAITRNDFPIKSLGEEKLLSPRKEVDIVLPNEYSVQLDYQWVKPGYECIAREGEIFTHFVIIGHSYAKCDRKEVDFILDNLSSNTNIIVANPYPDDDLIKKVENDFNNFEIWTNGPKEL